MQIYELIPENLKWVVDEDPVAVRDILKKGRTLENTHVKFSDYTRKDGALAQEFFRALTNNELLVAGRVRDFTEWANHWNRIRAEREAEKAEFRLQERIKKAREKAIREVQRARPNQFEVRVFQEESPSQMEELSSSDSSLEQVLDELDNYEINVIESENKNNNDRCCPLNIDCKDENCPLIHF